MKTRCSLFHELPFYTILHHITCPSSNCSTGSLSNISYKLKLTNKALNNLAPAYLTDVFSLTSYLTDYFSIAIPRSCHLRSAFSNLLTPITRTKRWTLGGSTFKLLLNYYLYVIWLTSNFTMLIIHLCLYMCIYIYKQGEEDYSKCFIILSYYLCDMNNVGDLHHLERLITWIYFICVLCNFTIDTVIQWYYGSFVLIVHWLLLQRGHIKFRFDLKQPTEALVCVQRRLDRFHISEGSAKITMRKIMNEKSANF